jgi:hypothetical protein
VTNNRGAIGVPLNAPQYPAYCHPLFESAPDGAHVFRCGVAYNSTAPADDAHTDNNNAPAHNHLTPITRLRYNKESASPYCPNAPIQPPFQIEAAPSALFLFSLRSIRD